MNWISSHWSRTNGTSVIASFVLGIGMLLLGEYLPFAAGSLKDELRVQ
jgi:hypothetical protein